MDPKDFALNESDERIAIRAVGLHDLLSAPIERQAVKDFA